MNIAYLILAHTKPLQLKRLIKRLYTGNTWFFIHLDSKTPFTGDFSDICREIPNVIYIERRVDVKWGAFSVVEAILNSLAQILSAGVWFDYICLMSGFDYPIKRNEYIFDFFNKYYGREFIHYRQLPIQEFTDGRMDRVWYYYDLDNYNSAFATPGWSCYENEMRARGIKRNFIPGMTPYHGSMWWCITSGCASYILNLIRQNKEIINFFRYTKFPDEQFFQSVIMNSPFAANAPSENLWYIDWSIPGAAHPKVLDLKDFQALRISNALFARKLDDQKSAALFDAIDRRLLKLSSCRI